MEKPLKTDSDLPNTAGIYIRPTSNTDEEKGSDGHDQPESPTTSPKQSAFKSLGWLDRFLALWILLAMAIGIILGNFVPETASALQKGQFVGVSVPIAVGLLVMMYPILCKVRYETLHELFSHRGIWKQIAFSVFMNWIVAPFLMLALAWACLPDKPELRTGLILVGLGRCIAMVLIWTGLAGGDNEYCAILVAVNSILQMVLFAPLAVFFIRIISHESGPLNVSYEVVATSVGTFLGIPLGAAILSRFGLRALVGPQWYERVFLRFVAPWSLIGLLYTILVLFAYQGQQVVHQIVSVLRVSVPLIVYFIVIFFLTLWTTHRCGFGYALGATQSFTAASNNFELAIAVAIATYGPNSDQALASTVGPLIEVPVLLGLVYVVKLIGNRWVWKD
ncbi:arsenical-resistance protein ACR3 [Annulohypoxylon stygium]|nr:arsenical-resistance protein ACR3 [Annulohypoxylon stygium]